MNVFRLGSFWVAMAIAIAFAAPPAYGQCPTSGTTLVSPADKSSVPEGSVAFSWDTQKEAVSYDLEISADGFRTSIKQSAQVVTSTTEKLAAGTWQWKVVSNFLTCKAMESAVFNLTVNACSITVGPKALPTGTVGLPYKGEPFTGNGKDPHVFSLASGTLPPGLTLDGNALTGTPTSKGTFPFTIAATDANGCTGSASYDFVVNCPSITLSPPGLPDGTVAAGYEAAISAEGGTKPYKFTAVDALKLPPGLLLGDNGVLSGLPTKAGTFDFTVTATDASGCQGTINYRVSICPAILITPPSLTKALLGEAYKDGFSASGGTASYTFTATGTLPPGLILTGDGTLSGTPTAVGTYSFDVTATDASGCRATIGFSIAIVCPVITPGPAVLPAATAGTGYKETLTASGATAPVNYAITLGSPPPGLSLASDGMLSGTPTTTGTYSFTVMATDANKCSGSGVVAIDVVDAKCPAISVGPATLPGATAGTAYKTELSASGGASPYSFATSDPLPAGLSLASDGTLSGTPTTVGSFKFVVTATDANKCSGSNTILIEIAAAACPAIAVGPSTLPNGTVGTGYKAGFTASGGVAPYTYSVAVGPLPPGLALEGDVISGTPTSSGAFKFVIAATDANRCTGSTSYAVEIAAVCPTTTATPVSPAAGATVDGAKGVAFSWNAADGAKSYEVLVSADGGTTFSVAASTSGTSATVTLPAGTYVWVVRASFGPDCKPTLSASSKFEVVAAANCPTAVPLLLSPPNGATEVETTVVFSWEAVKGAAKYALLLSVDGASPSAVATTAETSAKLEVPAGTIAWAVAAAFDGCPSTVSETFKFTTKTASTACPTQSPSLLAPDDGALNLTSPVKLAWSAVSEASGYRVHASVDGNPSVVLTTTAATSFEASFTAAAVVEWQVEAFFDRCPSTFSLRRKFTVTTASACETSAAVLVSPSNGATVHSPVTFGWNASKGAVGYRLFLSINGGSFELATTTTKLEHTQVLSAPAKVAWQVESLFLGCDPVRSTTSAFTLAEVKSCPEGSISLGAPAAGTVLSNPVSFSWTGINGASSYRVWVSLDGGAPYAAAKTTSTTASASLASGEVEWFVEALFDDHCRSIFSPSRRFTSRAADTCGTNQPPAIQSPAGSAAQPVDVTAPVDLRWSSTPGAEAYRVWLSVNGKAAEDIAATKETTLRVPLPAGSYAWFVEAIFAGCPSLHSTTGFFRVPQSEPRCSTDAPSIIAPADGATVTSSPVLFLWSSVPNAIEYRLHVLVDGEFMIIGTTSETSLSRAIPPGDLTWFVEAAFRECPSTSSARVKFSVPRAVNCPAERLELLSPRNGAESVESPAELSWSPISGAVRYAVIAKTALGDPTVIGETTAETFLKRHMPAGQSIEWWVVAFRGGCDPVLSDHGTFSVAAPDACDARSPVILSPQQLARVISPVHLSWTPSAGATGYRVWAAFADRHDLIATPEGTETEAALPAGQAEVYLEAIFTNCPPQRSSSIKFDVVPPPQACRTPERPRISVVGQALSGTPYTVRWEALGGAGAYELQESGSQSDFSLARTFVVQGASMHSFAYETGTPLQKFYRARGVSTCSDDRGPFSEIVGVHIVPANTIQQQRPGTAEIGLQQTVVQTVFIPGGETPVSFSATTDRPWLHVSPASGIIPPEGITLTVTADPSVLALGANTGTLLITYGGASGMRAVTHSSQPGSVPVSVSLVTPVVPGGKNTPPAEALIIPAVGHAPGVNNSLFKSDVRVANTSTQAVTYQLNFTPSGVDGTLTGSSTTIQVQPGGTAALNDILASFFGTGPGSSAIGVLEIRPLISPNTSSALASALATATIASSRTYNTTENGTLGQYIPAIPFSKFVGKPADGSRAILSMQQIAENAAYRTNLGLVEASGQPAELMIRIFDAAGQVVAEIPEALKAGEHKQINAILGRFGIQLDDGRIEVEVTSSTGRITAYASRVDNLTNDPLLVQPVIKSAVQATRYVVPGVAFADGLAKWRSDVRIFNSAESSAAATITYFPQGNPAAAIARQVTLAAGEVLALDNVLHQFFGINEANAGGSLLVSTAVPSSLVATARTYAQTDNGTYGLFAPGVTPNEAVGAGQRSLHLLQLEQSADYRTNVGLVETTGMPAIVEVSLILPDSKVTPKVQINLAGNGFEQFPLAAFNAGNAVYNARIAVKVVSGAGRVSAYGSVIDNRTNDSTYVPAQ